MKVINKFKRQRVQGTELQCSQLKGMVCLCESLGNADIVELVHFSRKTLKHTDR